MHYSVRKLIALLFIFTSTFVTQARVKALSAVQQFRRYCSTRGQFRARSLTSPKVRKPRLDGGNARGGKGKGYYRTQHRYSKKRGR